MSSSVTQVFHQEMSVYYLRPSFEYQELPSRLNRMAMDFHFHYFMFNCSENSRLGTRKKFNSKAKAYFEASWDVGFHLEIIISTFS